MRMLEAEWVLWLHVLPQELLLDGIWVLMPFLALGLVFLLLLEVL